MTAIGATGPVASSYAYDPLGRLQRITEASVATDLLYDGDRLSSEYNAAGALLRRYVHGPGVDEPLAWYEGAGTSDRRYLIADHQGSVIAEDGASVVRYAYGPYGEPNTWAGSRFRYTGQIVLPGGQFYHYKARAYWAEGGRFLQTDPVGYEDDLNLYMYVRNDPLNGYDPTGEETVVDLRGYRLGTNPITGRDFGHTYAQVTDTETGESVIFRGGPSENMAGNVSAAASNQQVGNSAGTGPITLFSQVDPEASSPDPQFARDAGGSELVQSSNLGDTPIGDVVSSFNATADALNQAAIPYQAQSSNSNFAAGVAFEQATGEYVQPSENYPGQEFVVDLERVRR